MWRDEGDGYGPFVVSELEPKRAAEMDEFLFQKKTHDLEAKKRRPKGTVLFFGGGGGDGGVLFDYVFFCFTWV